MLSDHSHTMAKLLQDIETPGKLRKAGPSLFEVVEAMGKQATLRHLNNFMTYLRS